MVRSNLWSGIFVNPYYFHLLKISTLTAVFKCDFFKIAFNPFQKQLVAPCHTQLNSHAHELQYQPRLNIIQNV